MIIYTDRKHCLNDTPASPTNTTLHHHFRHVVVIAAKVGDTKILLGAKSWYFVSFVFQVCTGI